MLYHDHYGDSLQDILDAFLSAPLDFFRDEDGNVLFTVHSDRVGQLWFVDHEVDEIIPAVHGPNKPEDDYEIIPLV